MGDNEEANVGKISASRNENSVISDPLDGERYAPEGWTLPAAALLKRYFEGEPFGGVQNFTRCPISIAAKVIAALEEACPGGPQHVVYDEDGVSSVQLVERAQGLRDVRVRGFIVSPDRWDERIDFTSYCH